MTKPNHRLATALALLLSLIILIGLLLLARRDTSPPQTATEYVEYERGRVTQILSDSCQPDPTAGGAYRGEQTLLVELSTGQYKGETLLTQHTVGPIYGEPARVGQRLILAISTYENGDHRAAVYEYDRSPAVYLLVAAFLAVTALVGRKTGLKSIVGLALTVFCLLFVLIPLLLKGWPTVPTTFGLCSYIAVVCFLILGGMNRKTLCACLGTVAGMALAMVFGLAAQALAHVNGLRMTDAEALLQLRQTGESAIQIQGLLVAGVIVSSLGAVMDVAMSISSALRELKAVNPQLRFRQLWQSGMNIGRDMVGTMTNTLILAFLGSSLVLIIYLYSLELPFHQLMSSAYLSLELISGLSSATGVILAVPLTAAIGALLYGRPHT